PGTISNVYTHGSGWSKGSPPDASATESIVINSGNITLNDDVSGCSCKVNGGSLTVASGKTLTLTGPVLSGGGTITFEDGSSLIQPNGVVNTGTIKYKRNSQPMRKYDFTYWSSPVTGISL